MFQAAPALEQEDAVRANIYVVQRGFSSTRLRNSQANWHGGKKSRAGQPGRLNVVHPGVAGKRLARPTSVAEKDHRIEEGLLEF